MRPVVSLLILLSLVACGESTETKLAKCKADMLVDFDKVVVAKKDSKKPNEVFATMMLAAMKPLFELSLATLTGPEGLAKCQAQLARNLAELDKN